MKVIPPICFRHPDTRLEWENGGEDKPTVFGRYCCKKCDADLALALDSENR